jgi:uncharacterized protein (TIGR02996 family)
MAKKKVSTVDEVGLLRAIRAVPEDDTPRLVYADWLDENGQPERAEFIRVSCRLAGLDLYDPEFFPLHWRRGQLLTDARRKAWGELPVKPVKEKHFHRGFIDNISLQASVFLAGADQLFSQIPLRTVRPLRIGPVWDELLASPHLLRVRVLDLHHSAMSGVRCRALAACSQLANLHELNLGANPMGAAGVQAILGSRYLGNLRRLDLNSSAVGNDALAALVGNNNFPHLRRLDLSANKIGPEGVGHLVRAPWLSRLESLNLSGNPLGDAGVHQLAESGLLAGHRSLELSGVNLGVEGVRSLANCPHLGGLTKLTLDGHQNKDFLKELAQSTTLTQLRMLSLGRGSGAGRDGVEALVRSPLAARLRVLNLSPKLPPDAFLTLLTARALSGLTRLAVDGSEEKGGEKLDVGGVLRAATHLTNLHFLEIDASTVRDPDLVALADCAHLDRLVVLSLPHASVTDAGVEALVTSPHFTHLRRLRLPYYGVSSLSAPVRTRLKARFGADVFEYYY